MGKVGLGSERKRKWFSLLPFRLELLEHFSLRVVPDDLDVDEAAEVEALGSELSHWRRSVVLPRCSLQ